jgi:hypothetical protein
LTYQVEVLELDKNESALRRRSTPSKGPASILLEKHSSSTRLASQLNHCSQRLVDSVARQNLASAVEHGSGRKSLSESVDPSYPPSNVSLRKQFDRDEEYNADVKMDKNSDGSSLPQVNYLFSLLMLAVYSHLGAPVGLKALGTFAMCF